jgi:hypothetical protein
MGGDRRRPLLDLDLHEAGDCGPANGALVGLHADNLRALNAQTHVAAREHHCILSSCEANDTLSLSLVRDIGSCVVDAVDVVQVKDRVVVLHSLVTGWKAYEEFLFQELVFEGARTLLEELTVGYLNRLLRPALVTRWVKGLDRHDYGIVVILKVDQVVSAVLS